MASDLVQITKEGRMKVSYHPGQSLALQSEATETYIIAGLQSGKTTFLPHWLRREMRRCGPGHRTLVYLVIGPTFAVLGNKTVGEFRRIFEDMTGWGKFIQSPKMRIEITPKGEIDLWGHRQSQQTNIYFCYADDPNSFAGFTALAAVGDEIGQPRFKRSAHTELTGRLSVARGDIAPHNDKVGMPRDLKMGRFCGGSIVYGLNWIYDFNKQWKKVAKQARKDDPVNFYKNFSTGRIHPKFHFIRFDSTLNPSFPQSEFDIAKATMEEWYFNMRYRGIFTRPAGLIYNVWNSAYEQAQVWPIPNDWARASAFDPGDVNFYGIFGAQNPKDDHWNIYDTFYDGEHSFKERGKIISELSPNMIWSIVGQISEDRWRRDLMLGGLNCQAPPVRDFWAGITNNVAAMKMGMLHIHKDTCGDLIDDLGTYSRPVDEAGKPIFGKPPEDEAQRHLMASLRYFGTKAFFGLGDIGSAVAANSSSLRAGTGEGKQTRSGNTTVSYSKGPVAGSIVHSAAGELRDVALGGNSGDRFLE